MTNNRSSSANLSEIYYLWLGIPVVEQPANHYRLLGLAAFEYNPEVIEAAADRQMNHVRSYASGPHGVASQQILNELSAAKIVLLDENRKAKYDAGLRARLAGTPTGGAPLAQIPTQVFSVRPAEPRSPSRHGSAHRSRASEARRFTPQTLTLCAIAILTSAVALIFFAHLASLAIAVRTDAQENNLDRESPLKAASPVLPVASADNDAGSSAKSVAAPVVASDAHTRAVQPASPEPAIVPFDPQRAKEIQAAWARYLGRPVIETNSLGMKFVVVPPGKFMMGSAADGIDNEKPTHEVSLTHAFYLGENEVTVAQFQQFVNDAAYPEAEKPNQWEGAVKQYSPTPDCPVNNVNWFDAVLFCNWLSWREGREFAYTRGDGDAWQCDWTVNAYRLPSEAEWEYACRAGNSGEFCFGDDDERLREYGWFSANANGRIWPVGVKLPNAWGLFDMHGNVFEWCWDWRAPYVAGARIDPTGPPAGGSRVLRSGVFVGDASLCRSAYRGAYEPSHRLADYGIRVCRGG